MLNNVLITIPSDFKFCSLEFKTLDNGVLSYNHRAMNDLVVASGHFLPMLSSKLIREVIVKAYREHVKKGGDKNDDAEQLVLDEDYRKIEHGVYSAKLDIPSEFNYLSLNLERLGSGIVDYNKYLLNRLLEHNGTSLEDCSDNDVFQILYLLYLNYIKTTGERDLSSDVFFGLRAASETPRRNHLGAIIKSPSAADIKLVRENTGLSQPETAGMLGLSGRQLISDYERSIKMPSDQVYTLWLLLTDQHPTLSVVNKK